MEAEDWRVIGIVAGVHGLRGALKLAPLSDFPERFEVLGAVYLRRGDVIEAKCTVKRVRWAGSQLLVTLKEIGTREEAQKLQGAELCVPEREAWQLPPDTFYCSDLLGCSAVAEDGTRIGIVKSIVSGPQDILEIESESGELLVPFVREWVGRVSLAERTVEILHWRKLVETETVEELSRSDGH